MKTKVQGQIRNDSIIQTAATQISSTQHHIALSQRSLRKAVVRRLIHIYPILLAIHRMGDMRHRRVIGFAEALDFEKLGIPTPSHVAALHFQQQARLMHTTGIQRPLRLGAIPRIMTNDGYLMDSDIPADWKRHHTG